MMKLKHSLIFLFLFCGCYTSSMGTLPLVQIKGEMVPLREDTEGTIMVRTCDPINLTDAMIGIKSQKDDLLGLKDFEMYTTASGVRNCWKIRGIPVTRGAK
ncbi:MAG: hypothetical protein K8S54_16005 [Spirochaetia bacterium]|nr:hypothetical protein [Spirochaetia bacterium]